MTQRDEFNSGKAFQGDRAFSLRTIPVNARISRASATITPIDAGKGVAPFTETIAFSGNNGDFGATKSVAANWTEVEFHGRRTLVSVEGTGLDNCTLQVDLGGGAYAEINPAGAFRTPSDTDVFHLKGNPAPLPGLTVAKFKLTAPPSGAAPAVTKVTIRSVPSSVSIRLGALAPVFTHPGEMTGPLTTPDFAPILQALLADTKVDNGFYDIPVILHSDNIGRLELVFEIDSASRQSALPAGLKEIVLEYGYDTVPRPGSGALSIAVPVASQSAPEAITARVRGAFDETRIVFGPTGEANPDGFAGITGSVSVAQPFSPLAATGATAIDLLLDVVDRTAHMRLDFRADLDGRPDDTTLLPSPVEFDLDRDALAGKSQWTSVALPSEFQFQAKRYWIVLQSIAGAANWRTQPADPTHPALPTTTD